MLRRLFARSARDTSGAAAVEFGVLVPLLAIMLVPVGDIGFGVYRKMLVEDSAQAGVQYAIAHGFDADAITNAVTNATSSAAISASPPPTTFCGCATSSGISTMSCGTTCPGGALTGTYAIVSAQATYSMIVNYQVVPESYTFSTRATVRLQ